MSSQEDKLEIKGCKGLSNVELNGPSLANVYGVSLGSRGKEKEIELILDSFNFPFPIEPKNIWSQEEMVSFNRKKKHLLKMTLIFPSCFPYHICLFGGRPSEMSWTALHLSRTLWKAFN